MDGDKLAERKRFEEWYTTHAFNYSRDPIGSRDCSLQWESWEAALAAHSAHGVGDGWKDPTGFSAAMVSDEAENWTPRETGKQMLRNYAAMLAAEVARHDT